jgi:hypothetical protein
MTVPVARPRLALDLVRVRLSLKAVQERADSIQPPPRQTSP